MIEFQGKHIARVWLLGNRIDLKKIKSTDSPVMSPVVITSENYSYKFIFKFGAVVFVNHDEEEEKKFVKSLHPFVTGIMSF